jgi:hypothetical protein
MRKNEKHELVNKNETVVSSVSFLTAFSLSGLGVIP